MEELEAQVAQLSSQVAALQAQLTNAIAQHVHGQNAANVQLKGIFGLFEVVSAVPTLTPKGVYDQIKLYVNGSTITLYWYDYLNYAWRGFGAAAAFYRGVVRSNAAGTPFPSGWTLTHVGTGIYKITHGLGTSNVSLVAFPTFAGEAFCIAGYAPVDTNNIEVYINNPDSSFAFQDSDFDFILST